MHFLVNFILFFLKVYFVNLFYHLKELCRTRRTTEIWTTAWPNIIICLILLMMLWGMIQKAMWFLSLLWKLLKLMLRVIRILLRILNL
ncbi:TPA_asm: P overlapped [Triticum alphacytorhabdovirus 1]|nr:TPA_asm: P overlapped [Triticum alphacytorhabdovirus 1]